MEEAAKQISDASSEEVLPVMNRADTIAAVVKQVEYYFCKENLQSDAFLTSHMDANMTVAIAVVMKVPVVCLFVYSVPRKACVIHHNIIYLVLSFQCPTISILISVCQDETFDY